MMGDQEARDRDLGGIRGLLIAVPVSLVLWLFLAVLALTVADALSGTA